MTTFSNAGPGRSIRDFFDNVSTQYDDTIRRTIPPYQEMFEALVNYTFLDRQAPLEILELGCGTGNLSLFAGSVFPNAKLTLMDLSPEMLTQAGNKLAHLKNPPQLVEGGFMDVELPMQHYDLIISSVALHHLPDAEKPPMYRRIYNWLKPGGLFRCADEVKTLPADQAMSLNEAHWIVWCKENGGTDEEIAFWQDHALKYDHYASLHEHFSWMAAAGFSEIDCYWKRVLWAVFGGCRAPG
jgi:tRNA (cmo5U34)-methyltransferase